MSSRRPTMKTICQRQTPCLSFLEVLGNTLRVISDSFLRKDCKRRYFSRENKRGSYFCKTGKCGYMDQSYLKDRDACI
jgi:hypothetical protein